MVAETSKTPISIIIPTYQRPRELARCLRSLADLDDGSIEIVVVDNDRNCSAESVVQDAQLAITGELRYMVEPILGVSRARHTGVREAGASVLAFIDDDVTISPDWVQGYRDAFERFPEMGAAGGPVRPRWATRPPLWLEEEILESATYPALSLMDLGDEFRLSRHENFFSCNMAIRRHVLFASGGFNPEAFGETWLGNGESGLNKRMSERGTLIGYVPAAFVWHHIPPNRATLRYLMKRARNQAAADCYTRFSRKPATLVHVAIIVGRSTGKFFTYSMLFAALSLARSRHWRKALIRMSYALGELGFVKYILMNRDFRHSLGRTDWLDHE